MNAYEITKEYEALRALEEAFEIDEETGEFIDNSKELEALLDGINSERDTKLKGIEYIKREYQSINSTIDDEIKRLKFKEYEYPVNKFIDPIKNNSSRGGEASTGSFP